MGLAVGPGPAGLAHRVLGDGGGAARAGVRDPRRRARPRLPPPRERAGAVARARARVRARSGRTTACSASPARRCRSRSATSITHPRGARRVGPRDAAALLPDRPLAQADRLLRRRRWPQAQARREMFRNAFRSRRASRAGALGRLRRRRSTTTSTRPRRSRVLHEWRRRAARPAAARRSGSSASARSPSRTRRPSEVVALAERRAEARARERTSTEADRLRDEIEAAGWEMRDDARRLPARAAAVTRDLVYGRRPCARRCAAGARCSSSGRPSGRSAPSRGSRRRARAGQARPRADRGSPARATTRACSRASSRTATPTPTSSPAAERPLLAVLDQVTDPRNLGAVCRSAEGAGATGVVVPAHGSAIVTPPSRARRRARSSTCRSRSSRTSRATSRR